MVIDEEPAGRFAFGGLFAPVSLAFWKCASSAIDSAGLNRDRGVIMQVKTIVLAAALAGVPGLLHAQFEFKLADRSIQVHSFASQGFAYSNDNNYLTMNTSGGSFGMTDGGVNVSTQITDKFRVGAQFYSRNIGNLGNYRPDIDWALGDYRFTSWFGIRAGRVKTTLGLYNDTQDLEFLHTWAILPQSVYPLDLRASTISHTGGDVYGTISRKRLGSVSYTAYAGSQLDDKNGGYRYGAQSFGLQIKSISRAQVGADLRWNSPLKGLVVGASYLSIPGGAAATVALAPTMILPVTIDASDRTSVFYAEYKTGGLTLAGEYRRELLSGTEQVSVMPTIPFREDERAWWASAAYRVSPWLELGTYHSRFYPDWALAYHSAAANHLFDHTVTARFDLNRHWDFKVEGHFIDGVGSPTSFRGFYPQDNPTGMQPRTTMFVLRTGWNF
jgi:hypothetical protein